MLIGGKADGDHRGRGTRVNACTNDDQFEPQVATLGRRLFGGIGNDRFYGGAGDDVLYGGAGIDYAYFSGKRADYVLTKSGSSIVVSHTGGTGLDGVDRLIGVEYAVFSDQTVEL